MPSVTTAIGNFLRAQEHNAPDLIERWNTGMETQVFVQRADGWPAKDAEGNQLRNTYENGQFRWWNIRVPKKANSEPEWNDYELNWPLDLYAEAIGCTGWKWDERVSRWIGFDFDSITGHAEGHGISKEQLEQVRDLASTLPYVEVRKSTGGAGIHLYVLLDDIPTANHTEHAALARCILSKMSSECGFDFTSQNGMKLVDVMGGNMWIWHRKMTKENEGLKLLKPSEQVITIADLPSNWRDHIDVITKSRSKIRISGIPDGELSVFDELTSSQKVVTLDDTHKAIINQIGRCGYSCVWVPDHHLVQTHTAGLKQVMVEHGAALGLKGFFDTNSQGSDRGTPNCFMFPTENGGFKVYRFGKGHRECATWHQDGNDYTWCEFNATPDLASASLALGGSEIPDDKGYSFVSAESAAKVIHSLGMSLEIPEIIAGNKSILKKNKDGRVIIEIEKSAENPKEMPGWDTSKSKLYRKVINVKAEANKEELEFDRYDKLIRCLVTPAGNHAGWIHRSVDLNWIHHPKDNCRSMLAALGKTKPEAEQILGLCAMKHWTMVCLPFQHEYPGGRKWNKDAPQYKVQPAELEDDCEPQHKHWDMILEHIGADLTETIQGLEWCQRAHIHSGKDYFIQWLACLLREPFQPLPYLFLFGPQKSGKSIFHEAVKECLVTGGVNIIDKALTNPNGFNAELENCILGVIEETDLSSSQTAYNRIKLWTTSPYISIRKMRQDAYDVRNTAHFVQTAQSRNHARAELGDTRLTFCHVPALEQQIPKKILMDRLREEAPQFMRTLMTVELAKVEDRMRLPVIDTERKKSTLEGHRHSLDTFIEEHCYQHPGGQVLFTEFYDAYRSWLEDHGQEERFEWTKRRVTNSLPDEYATRRGTANKVYVTNLSLTPVV